jgi:protein transport protein SEC20
MMASELSRSQFAHDTLKESTAALEALSETYSTLDTMLSSSKNLLGTLLRSQKSDTWYLETAFYILLATIGWLIWRRILYGPTWWLVWFPMKMFIKGWMGVFAAMGLRGGSNSDVGVSSSSIAASSTVVAPTSVVHNKATRIPKTPGGKPPSVNVGGGGRGAPMNGPNVPGMQQGSGESVSEQVGRIIDESQSGELRKEDTTEGALEEQGEQDEVKPNPKKRMWEEKEAPIKAQRQRDEL